MTEQAHTQGRENKTNVYASHEDFHTIFNEDLKELYRLSFLLTRDLAKAERCFVSGLEDCVSGNPVFREWARSWAKRTIVQNAIRELKPRPSQSNSPLSGAMFSDVDQISKGLADTSKSTPCCSLQISIGLYSSCLSWSITRNRTVPFSSGAPLETFGSDVLVL
jgi:hypothetical protein